MSLTCIVKRLSILVHNFFSFVLFFLPQNYRAYDRSTITIAIKFITPVTIFKILAIRKIISLQLLSSCSDLLSQFCTEDHVDLQYEFEINTPFNFKHYATKDA